MKRLEIKNNQLELLKHNMSKIVWDQLSKNPNYLGKLKKKLKKTI